MHRAAAVTLALVLSTGAARAQTITPDDTARRALAAGEYQRVIAVYQSAQEGGYQLSDQAFYRLAIAFSRTGDAARAHSSLESALSLNPSGSFASTPARLQQLQVTIQQGCAQLPSRTCNSAVLVSQPQAAAAAPAAAASAPVAGAVEIPASTPAQAAASAPAPAAPEIAVQSLPAAAANSVAVAVAPLARPSTQAETPSDDGAQSGHVYWFIFLALMFASFAGHITYLVVLAFRGSKASPRMAEGWHPLLNLQDEIERVIKVMQTVPGGPAKEVTLALQDLLPLLEREIGRSLWRAGRGADKLVEADVEAIAVLQKLSVPIPATHANRSDVQSMFQRPAAMNPEVMNVVVGGSSA